jgi:alkylhydroperoxidase family enzyme
MFAVVARGLGCPETERDAAALLAAEGLDPGTTAQVLTHLAAPDLSPVEAELVPFARETIRYQPSAIQRRLRQLATGLSQEQLVELIGVAAFANLLCRIELALAAP